MDASTLMVVLSLGTLGAVLVLALISKRRTEERRHDPTAPKSTLAKDGPQGGVEALDPGPGVTPTPHPDSRETNRAPR
jgi:hypothetical protein